MFIPLKFVIDFPQNFRYNQYGFTISICIVMPFVGEYERYTYLYTASKPHIQTIRFNGDLYGRKNEPRTYQRIESAYKSASSYKAPHHLPAQHYSDVGVDHRYFGVVYAL